MIAAVASSNRNGSALEIRTENPKERLSYPFDP
jgi:hypothetical protein